MLKKLMEVSARKFHTHLSQEETKPQIKMKPLINIWSPATFEAGQNECEQYQPAYRLIFLYSRQMQTSKIRILSKLEKKNASINKDNIY
jgi:hypothetical protein